MSEKSGQRINGVALESIMQDVLLGMEEFTSEACLYCDAAGMEIIAVEKPQNDRHRSARVCAFPRKPAT